MNVRRLASLLALCVALFCSLPAAADSVTLTFLVSQSEYEWAHRMAEKFEQERGIKVDIQLESGAIREQLPVLIAGGVEPDVTFHLIGHGVHSMPEAFVDLRPYVERDSEMDLGLFPPVTVEAFTVPDGLPDAGKLLGIPYSMWGQTMGRNVNVWNEAGIAMPSNWTFDEFESIVQRLTQDKDGDGVPEVYGAQIPHFWPRNAIFVHRAGQYFFDRPLLPTVSYLTHPTVTEVMERMHGLFRGGYVGGNYTNLGNVAIRTDSRMSDFHDVSGNVGHEHEFIPYPTFPAGVTGAEVTPHGFLILETSPHKDEAWEWIKFLTVNVENQVDLGMDPAFPNNVANLIAAREVVMAKAQEIHPSVPVLITTLAEPDSFSRFTHPEASRMDAIMNGYFDRALRKDEMSIREALLRAHEEIEPFLAAFR